MPRQKRHANRVYQMIGEPGPGSEAAGYVRYSMELQDPASIVTQKRRIEEFAHKKGWALVRWYEEPEQSAKYEEAEQRPIFAQLLADAGSQFHIVLCYMNNRWARNAAVAYSSLGQLRRKRVWWATADGMWDIDKVQTDGFDVAFAVDTQMNAAYVRQLSKRVIDGKEDRARDGYHNGKVPFGYLPPAYPKAPDGAPSTWRPPRMPVRIDPVNFPALVRIGELAAQGWGDSAIADELESHFSMTPRFGSRSLTKDTVAAIRRMWFPREFGPGSGFGTIETPSGELVEGRHPAAWPYDLWQRMVEAKTVNYRRSGPYSRKHTHEFSRIIVCSGCMRPLRVQPYPSGYIYYRDTSATRKLPCPSGGFLQVNSTRVVEQFGELLATVRLPDTWRQIIAERCMAASRDVSREDVEARRQSLEKERARLITAFTKGYLSEADLDQRMEPLRSELRNLSTNNLPRDAESYVEASVSAGEMLADMASYWQEALPDERRDIVWAILKAGGLIYDLERRSVAGVQPRPEMLLVFSLGLSPDWAQRDGGLWRRDLDHFPKRAYARPLPPPTPPALTPEQRAEALALVKSGLSLRKVAARFAGVSYGAIWRLLRSQASQTDEASADPDVEP